MLYELRTYECFPGKLPLVLKRFHDHTISIWLKHGIEPVGFWTTVIGNSNNTLTYMLRWESLAERETKWSAFVKDPEYSAARAASELDGPIVQAVSNQILQPTSFSQLR
ncbi:MAG: NIPSNAP family protein [Mesorhizobium sp.]|nr:NIPSNAP family protein [Mesorhizobium sp.]